MATKFIESGTNATYGLEFYKTINGTVSSATDQAHTGSHSLKISILGGAFSGIIAPDNSVANTGRVSFWYRLSRLPTSGGSFQCFSPQTAAASNTMAIRITSTGQVFLDSGTGTILAAGTQSVTANTWNRISMAWSISSTTVWSAKIWVNGLQSVSASNTGTLNNAAPTTFNNGLFDASTATNSWTSDYYLDDSSSLTDPGDIRVTAKLPFANGTTNSFAGSGTPSSYGSGNARYVNQRPLDTTAFVSVIAAGAMTEEYNIENAAVGDVNLNGQSIVDYAGWVYAKAALSETASMIVNGATSSIALTSANTLFENYAGSTTYPTGTGADIGITTTGLATTVTLNECGVVVAYKYPGYFF